MEAFHDEMVTIFHDRRSHNRNRRGRYRRTNSRIEEALKVSSNEIEADAKSSAALLASSLDVKTGAREIKNCAILLTAQKAIRACY